jgi:hypothetical protein
MAIAPIVAINFALVPWPLCAYTAVLFLLPVFVECVALAQWLIFYLVAFSMAWAAFPFPLLSPR